MSPLFGQTLAACVADLIRAKTTAPDHGSSAPAPAKLAREVLTGELAAMGVARAPLFPSSNCPANCGAAPADAARFSAKSLARPVPRAVYSGVVLGQ
jgi:hypothetical protein